MSAPELVPYDQMSATIDKKLSLLSQYQQADCTAEFDELSTQLYGGNIFGENGRATCSNTSQGPAIHFFDRTITQRVNHGSAPLQVATMNHEGLHIAQEAVFLEWLANRSISDDGEFAFASIRQAVLNSPLEGLRRIPLATWRDIIPKVGQTRVEAGSGMLGLSFVTPGNTDQRKRKIASIASEINHPQATDLAEVIGTENQLVPQVLRTPDAASCLMNVLEGTYDRRLECSTTGLWMAVAHRGMVGIRGELFLQGESHRDRLVESFEDKTRSSGPRLVKAIGDNLDQSEYDLICSSGQVVDNLAKRTWGNAYATPYKIEQGAFPYGTLLDGQLKGLPYRIYLPLENA